MKIKKGFVLRELGDQNIIVATGELSKTFNSIVTVNKTGAFIFLELENDKTLDQLVDVVVNKYDISRDLALNDITLFVDKLKESKILDE